MKNILNSSLNSKNVICYLPLIEKNKKRDVRNWFNHEPGTSAEQYQQQIPLDIDRRGDIPIMSGDCEGKIRNISYTLIIVTYSL